MSLSRWIAIIPFVQNGWSFAALVLVLIVGVMLRKHWPD
jgi:hypothetical protein